MSFFTYVKLLTEQIEELKKEKEECKQESLKWQDLYISRNHNLQEVILPELSNSKEDTNVSTNKEGWNKKFTKYFLNFFARQSILSLFLFTLGILCILLFVYITIT